MTSKRKTQLMRFNFNESFNRFQCVPLCQPERSRQASLTKTLETFKESDKKAGSGSDSKSPTERDKCQTMLNFNKVNIQADLPKLDISELRHPKFKIFTGKKKKKFENKFKEFLENSL